MTEICFVLVEPGVPENVGAAARALRTMGFDRLRIVNSQAHTAKPARILAHGAGDVLDAVQHYPGLVQALADVDISIASSAKARLDKRYAVPARELGPLIAAKAGLVTRVAVVFGCESSGLSNADLARCDLHTFIPLAQPYPSLNLAQAVMLYAWELSGLAAAAAPERPLAAGEWQHFQRRALARLETLGFSDDSKLAGWAGERMAMLGADDVRFLQLLLGALEQTDR